MDREVVKQRIKNSSIDDLKAWRVHAVRCLEHFIKYPNKYEQEECEFVIHHIDEQLQKLKAQCENE